MTSSTTSSRFRFLLRAAATVSAMAGVKTADLCHDVELCPDRGFTET
jgi:hypothetical protein